MRREITWSGRSGRRFSGWRACVRRPYWAFERPGARHKKKQGSGGSRPDPCQFTCKKREGINRETGGLYPRAPCLARQPDRLTPFQDNLPLDGAGAYWTLVQPGLRSSAGVFLRDFPEAASPRGASLSVELRLTAARRFSRRFFRPTPMPACANDGLRVLLFPPRLDCGPIVRAVSRG